MRASHTDSSSASVQDTNDVRQQVDQFSRQMINGITCRRSLRKLSQRILCMILKGPRREVVHDWHVVHSFLERAIDHCVCEGAAEQSKMHTLGTIKAYLELARIERDFAQAWTYVNVADSFLPLVVHKKELGACEERLRCRDSALPYLMKRCIEEMRAKIVNGGEKAEERRDSGKGEVEEDDTRQSLHCLQEARALSWNCLNSKISLRISLWCSVGFYLALGLACAVVIAEVLNLLSPQQCPLVQFPFVAVSLLGFFGGGVSAFVKARSAVIDIRSYETIRIYTLLRMLLGAAGALVVFIGAKWVLKDSVGHLVSTDMYAFLMVGILAGFSERLFIGTLEKMADKLDIFGERD